MSRATEHKGGVVAEFFFKTEFEYPSGQEKAKKVVARLQE